MIAYRTIAICLVLLGEVGCFVNPRSFHNSQVLSAKRFNEDIFLFEAEEAAAVDAHDLSDPGMEGAAMERAVIMAADVMIQPNDQKPKIAFMKMIQSLFHHGEEDVSEDDLLAAEANYARALSNAAAIEHADEILTTDRILTEISKNEDVVDQLEEDDFLDVDLFDAWKTEAEYARHLSDDAAMDHVVSVEKKDEEAHIVSAEEHHKSIDKDNEDVFIFEDEEAAALQAAVVDAHDLNDAGMEAAAMERAVIMAADVKGQPNDKKPTFAFMKKIRSLFHIEEDASENDLLAAEADYARALSNAAAIDHADKILAEDSTNDEEMVDKQDLFDAWETEAEYARHLSDDAAMDHLHNAEKKDEEAHIVSVEEHYKSIDKDIKTIEHLIEEADKADHSDGHLLERTFSDDDAEDLALMMIEKSVLAATDKIELCQKKAEETEAEVKAALESKYAAKALAESIERDRRAAEMRFLSANYIFDVEERSRDTAILHADKDLLSDALKQEHEAEMKLEEAIEHDIAAKKELEQMIDNKAILKRELYDLESIIHEHTLTLMDEENAKKPKSEQHHHSQWWHNKW